MPWVQNNRLIVYLIMSMITPVVCLKELCYKIDVKISRLCPLYCIDRFRSKRMQSSILTDTICASVSPERSCSQWITARSQACKEKMEVLHKYIVTIIAVTMHLKRDLPAERYFNTHWTRGANKMFTRRTVRFHMTSTLFIVINIPTALSHVNVWRTLYIFCRTLNEYSIRNVNLTRMPIIFYLHDVTVLDRTKAAIEQLRTKGIGFLPKSHNTWVKMLQCTWFAHYCSFLTNITSIHVYMNNILFWRFIVDMNSSCLCLLFIVSLLPLIIDQLSRNQHRTNVISRHVCYMDILGKIKHVQSRLSVIQPLSACTDQSALASRGSNQLSAWKSQPSDADKEEISKKDVDDKFEESPKHNGEDFLARLRKYIWLPSNEVIRGFTTSSWVFPLESPVIAIISRLAEGNSVHPRESMRHELLRLCTFRSYQSHGKPSCIKMAKAGFYYASQGDEVICYCCAKRVSNWNERDDPMHAHRLVSPNCPFLVRNSEVNEPVTNDNNDSSNPRLSRILHSLDASEEQTETRRVENAPAARAQVSHIPTASRLNTTEHTNLPQNGACRHVTEYNAGLSTQMSPKTTVGISQYTSLPVQSRRNSSIPAGSFVCSSVAEAPVNAPNARRATETPVKRADSLIQGASSRRPDEIREQLVRENRALKEQSKCLRCRRDDVCIAFLPCGHLVSCEACSTDPSARKCFSCGAAVKARIKAFVA